MKRPAQQAGQATQLNSGKAIVPRNTGEVHPSKREAVNIRAAIWYARRGYAPLPCMALGKAPATPNGLKDATKHLDKVREMFAKNDQYNVGILPPPNVLVLDVDDPAQLEPLLEQFPELREAPMHCTPRGGYHLFVRVPNGWSCSTRTQALPGVDIRGLGKAYVLAPPSVVRWAEQ